MQEPQHTIDVTQYEYLSTRINSYVSSGDDKVCDIWCQILPSERIAGKTLFNLFEGRSEQLRHCVPGEASDARFYPKPKWYSTDQVTSCISQMVSPLIENFSGRPTPVFVEFQHRIPSRNSTQNN